MKFYKRTLSFILAFIIAFSPLTSAFAKTNTDAKETKINAQEIEIGDTAYYVFSTDKNIKRELVEAQEQNDLKTEEIETVDGLDVSDTLFDDPVKAEKAIPYTINIKGSNYIGVGGKNFDWDTLPDGLELQVFYINEDGIDVNVGSPITINRSNFTDEISRTFDIAGEPIAFGLKTNVDSETYLTDVYLTNEKAPDPWVASLDMTFDLVQVPSTKLDVKWMDVNQQPLARENTPATSLKDILTFNFIENRKFDLPNQDKEDPYFRLVNKIERKDIKDMDGATALVDGKKDGEVTLDGKIYKLTTSYDPAFNKGSVIQLMFMPDVIDRTKNPGSPTPNNYVRVTIDAGEGTKLADGETKKVYDVRIGKSLEEKHYPKLEISDSAKYKEPITWTIAPGTAITQSEDIKGNAAKTAAQTITAANLAPNTITALQGQDLTEKDWHEGVVLADNTPEDKKDAFEALLKDATVTDKSSRTTAAAGTFEGTLLVTFKDGSTIEVPKQNLIVKPNTVTIAFDKAEGQEKPLRDGDTTVKGKITAPSNSKELPVSLDGALVTIKKGNEVLSRTLAKADGSFVAGVKDPLVAGEEISVVVTLPQSKTESAPVKETVQLNPDKLNSIIPTGKAVYDHFNGKKGVNQELVTKLKEALDAADKLVDKNGKVLGTVPVTDKGQESLNTAYENIKKAIEALTGNSAPKIEGATSHKEIFKGDALNLEEGITVTDADGESDIVKDGQKAFTYAVQKVDAKGNKTPVTDTTTIKDTAGTYEVTYTAKDKSGAEGTFVMTLVVKEPLVEIKDNFPDPIPEGYVKVEFKPGDHGTLEGTTKFLVKDGSAKTILNAPTIKPNANYEANKKANWDPAIPETFTGTKENNKSFTFTAQYTYNGPDVVEQKPGDKKPDVPSNFVKVEFKKGEHGVISSEYTTIYWVNPEAGKTLKDITKPTVTALEGYKFTGWDKDDKTAITAALDVTAQYKEKVVTEEPKIDDPKKPGEKITDPDYAVLTFNKGDNGEFAENAKTTIWVLKNEDVKFNAPAVKANDGFVFNGWEPALQTKYNKDETHTAKYEPKSNISDTPVAGFQEVKFLPGTDGKFEGEKQEKSVWVRPGVKVDLTGKAPKVIANKGKVHTGWEPSLIGTFTKSDAATEITAQYKTDADGNGVADETETTATPTVTARNIGKDPQKTTVEGTAPKGSTVTIKYPVTNDQGKTETKEITTTADDEGKYTAEIEPKLPVDTEVTVTAKDGEKKESLPEKTHVFDDKDNDGKDDRSQDFDITKVEKLEIVKQPKLKYTAKNEKDGETKFKLDLKDMVIRLTDKAGKEKLAIVKEDGKFYDYDDQTKEITQLTATPAHGTKLIPETSATEKGDSGKKIKITGPNDKFVETNELQVFYDANGDDTPDYKDGQKTQTPSIMARNIGEKPDKTTVEGLATPGAVIKITDKDGKVLTTEPAKIVAGPDGKYTATISPKLDDGTEIKATAKLGEMAESDPAVTTVFDDVNDDKIRDGQTERPAAIASNIGKKPEFTTITGEAEKGAKVVAKVGETVVGEATADPETGKYTIKATTDGTTNGSPIKEGVKIDVTATLAPKAESLKQTVVVFKDTDGDGQPDSAKDFNVKKVTGMQVVSSPDKMVYSDGDELNLDGLRVLLTDVYGNQKIFTYNNAKNDEFTGAGLSVDYKQGDKLTNADNGKKLTVTLDTKKNTEVTKAITGETPTALTVNKNQSAQPTDVVAANQADNQVTKVKGKATKDAVIKITDANGNNLLPDGKTIKADANGDFTADLKDLLDPGTKVIVTATEPGKSESPKAETPVIRDKDGNWKADTGSKLSTPVIDPIREKDEKVVVEAPKAEDKIQTIEVSDQNGKTVKLTKDPADATGKTWKVDGSNDTVKENSDGKLEIPVKGTLPLNDRDQIKVTFKDGEKPTPNEAFDKAPVQKASQTPTVDPVYTGDKNVKIVDPTVADPTAKTIKVKVGENDTMVIEKQADNSWKVKNNPNAKVEVKDGKVVVPLEDKAKKDDVIKVSTINDSKVESPQAEVTVIDKEKSTTPTVNPVATNDTKITGKAGPNADVVITITPKDGGTPKEIVTKADKDGNFTVPADGLKDGDTIVAKATEKDKAPAESAPVTVGVDTTGLDKAIQDGKDALDPEKGGKNNGTPADKKLEEAIKEGEDLKKRDPAPTQKELDDAKDKIEKAIEEKKETDKALDELKKAKEELDKTIEDAKDDKKPREEIRKGQDSSKEAGTVIGNKGEGKTSEQIKDLVEKTKEADRLLKLPVIQVTIDTAVDGGKSIVFTTNPGRCKITVIITRSDRTKETYDAETGPGGTGSIRLEKALEDGDSVRVSATRKTETRPVPDYLDNYTSTGV